MRKQSKRGLRAANDNGPKLEIASELSATIPLTEIELRVLETHLMDVIAKLTKAHANDNKGKVK